MLGEAGVGRDLETSRGVQGGEVGLARGEAALQDRLDLRGEDQPVARLVVVEGLDAEAVASRKQLVLRGVVDGEGEHAVQAVAGPAGPRLRRP